MKHTEKSSAPSQRQLRVAEEIRHIISQLLIQNDIYIQGLSPKFLMITKVSISPDLSYATVFVQSMNDIDIDNQLLLLNKHKGAFRYQLGKKVRLRIVPNVIFKSDASFQQSKFIDDLLNSPKVRADIDKPITDDVF